jgi:hypothetical protein
MGDLRFALLASLSHLFWECWIDEDDYLETGLTSEVMPFTFTWESTRAMR